MKKRIVTGLVLLVWQLSQAQVSNWHFHHLNVQNGLSEATNYYTLKDSRGFVWLSSISGLNRFDGRQVKVYQPDPADSTSVFGQNIQSPFFEDGNGDIWFSTYEGINRYIRQTDRFEHFVLKDNFNHPISGYYIANLDSDGNLWLLVDEQTIYLFNIRTHTFYRLHDIRKGMQRIVVQSTEKVKRLFAYSWNTGREGLQIITYLPNNQLSQQMLFDKTTRYPLSINELLVESDTLIWLATHKKGLLIFNPTTLLLEPTLVNSNTHSISHWTKQELLVGTIQGGIGVFDKKKKGYIKNFHHNNTPNSLADDFIDNIYTDHDGVIWAYIYGKGTDFAVPDKSKFQRLLHFPTETALIKPFNTTALTIDNNGNLWCGSNGNGVRVITPNGKIKHLFLTTSPNTRGLPSDWIYQMFVDKRGQVWLMHWSSISIYDGQKNHFKKITDAQHYFLYGLQTQNSKVLLASQNGGIYEAIEKKDGSFIFQKIDSINSSYTFSILAEDNEGFLWCSDALSIRVFDTKNNYKLVHQMPFSSVVTSFYFPKNNTKAWIASNNGLIEIDKMNNWYSTIYYEKDGLPSRTINSMNTDKQGNLWLGTTNGLAKFDPSVKSIKRYNLTDGISDITFNMYAAAYMADSMMYFGTSNGITTFQPNKILPLSIKARPIITEILINDQLKKNLFCATTSATNVSEIQRLVLPFSDNTLSFNFSAMEYSDPMQCLFQYKMVGIDNDWVNTGTLPFARYPNLRAGDYTFLIKAANSDGIWNETPRVLQVHINPPFWRTWWFITLCLLASMALVGYIVYLRLSKIIDLQEVRIKLYENLHDDLGSRLMAIVLMIDMALQKKGKSPPSVSEFENAHKTLTETKDIASTIVGNMRRLVWATDPENDELRNVVQQMKTDAHILLPPSVDFKIQIAESLLKLKVDGNKRYQMLSIVDEAFNNIAKYAEAKAVTLTIERDGDNLRQIINDNGKGFDPEKPREDKPNSSGRGLVNMLRRAKRINGTLTITSVLGESTTITLTFPLKSATFLQRLRRFFATYSPK